MVFLHSFTRRGSGHAYGIYPTEHAQAAVNLSDAVQVNDDNDETPWHCR